jgi:hypothetical protein
VRRYLAMTTSFSSIVPHMKSELALSGIWCQDSKQERRLEQQVHKDLSSQCSPWRHCPKLLGPKERTASSVLLQPKRKEPTLLDSKQTEQRSSLRCNLDFEARWPMIRLIGGYPHNSTLHMYSEPVHLHQESHEVVLFHLAANMIQLLLYGDLLQPLLQTCPRQIR